MLALARAARPLTRRAPPALFARCASAAAASAPASMFCFQCEQTSGGTGCTTVGVCGKTPDVAALQDLLVYRLKGLAGWTAHAHDVAGGSTPTTTAATHLFRAAIFSTLTNVNFDAPRFQEYVRDTNAMLGELKSEVAAKGGAPLEEPPMLPWFDGAVPHPFAWDMPPADEGSLDRLVELGTQAGIDARRARLGNETLLGLHELVTYGVKGAAAYGHHAALGGVDESAATLEIMRSLAFLCTPAAAEVGNVLGQALAVGGANIAIMGALESAHTGLFGHPSPTRVSNTPREGKCILVSGHDLTDLKALLDATAGKGISVYTHGEMLPAHGYPGLREYEHLAGHFGGAWYRQKHDFAHFPGAILMTTNCVLDPPTGKAGAYAANLFTTGEVGVKGVAHCAPKQFDALIERALALPGFTATDVAEKADAPTHLVGFGREATIGAAPAVLDAIKAGHLKHIFLIGGCDGSEGSRRYYQRVAQKLPQTSMVLTLGCAKYRLLGHDYGTVPGTELPRLLDMGQCNDSYAAVQVALALVQATGATSVNDLPLSLDISWFEQKAVAVLLSLLHLGITDIRLGPQLPAFLTPEALEVLVNAYNIKPADLKHPEEDIDAMLQHGH